MDDNDRSRQQMQVVSMLVMASGIVMLLVGIALLAVGGRVLLGAALAVAGVMDFGLGLFLRLR